MIDNPSNSSEIKIKTEPGTSSASNFLDIDTMMADFQSVEGGRSTILGDWPLKDFSKCATSMLLSDYKVEDKGILFTTAFAL